MLVGDAEGRHLHMKTKRERRRRPGIPRSHMPEKVRRVLTTAMRVCACSALPNSCANTMSEGATSV